VSQGIPGLPEDEGRAGGDGKVLGGFRSLLDPQDGEIQGVLHGAFQLYGGTDIHDLFLGDPTDGRGTDCSDCGERGGMLVRG